MKTLINFTALLLLLLFTFISCGGDVRSDTIQDVSYTLNPDDTVYEDAEDGNTSRWLESHGKKIENVEGGSNGSERSILVKENWLRDENGSFIVNEIGNYTNLAYYELPMVNDHQFILEFDKMRIMGEYEDSYCFTVGVKLDTLKGERHISFNTFFDYAKINPIEQLLNNDVKEMVFPLSMDYVTDINIWKRLRFDLKAHLHEFEPNNEINKVMSFYFVGGDDYLDNIRLVSQ